MNSGEGKLDAIERCQKFHWVYNQNVANNNAKVMLAEAPAHFKQDSCMMPEEATVFLLHGSHPFFEACGKEDASNPEDGLKITDKGTFKTRSSQRAEEKKRVKKELKALENNKMSSAKQEAALTHAQAANKAAENSAITTKTPSHLRSKRMQVQPNYPEGPHGPDIEVCFRREDHTLKRSKTRYKE